MARILHAADLHLDTQPSELRAYDEVVGEVLRDASLVAFDHLVETAIAEGVVACIFAGDIYDGAERGVRAQLRFRDGLGRLSDAGITSFLAYGNHDPVGEGWSAVRSWPGAVVEFAPGRPQVHVLETDDGAVAVHGVSYETRATTENLAARFARSGDERVQIGVLHANVGAQSGHEPYAPCTLDDLRASGLDYWALGHIHTRRTLAGPAPWVVYPGNLQGRSPRPSEQGPKGAVILEVAGGRVARAPAFVPLDVARFLSIEVDVADIGDLGELADELRDRAESARLEHAPRSLVLRGSLVGRSALRADLRRPGALEELRASLQRAEHVPFVWWDRIEDRTGAPVDLDEAALADDLTGHVLRRLDPHAVTTGPHDDDVLAGLGPTARRDLERLGVALPDPGDPELRDRARHLAYDVLAGEGP